MPILSSSRPLTRRRVLGIVAAAAGLPLAGYGVSALGGRRGEFITWSGAALGAESSLALWHADVALSRRMIQASLVEIARLERVFSLFDPESELSRLNRDGALPNPSAELVELLDVSRRLGDASGGAFDVTVQPLWTLYERHFAANPASAGPSETEIAEARARVDYRRIDLDRKQVRLAAKGMGVTLNGIAQGFITDRVADMLRDAGYEHVVAELGEIRAIGDHPEGRPWRMGIKDPLDPTRVARTVEIANQAVAVSGGYGSRFDAEGRNHHIFDPATGRSANRYLDVTVIGPRATAADGLSTALYVVDETTGARMLAGHPGTRALITRPDGRLVTLSA